MFTQNSLASALSLVGSLSHESKASSPTATCVVEYVIDIKECDFCQKLYLKSKKCFFSRSDQQLAVTQWCTQLL